MEYRRHSKMKEKVLYGSLMDFLIKNRPKQWNF
jgi:hypothetical protein